MPELSKQALIVENNTNFPNNNTGYITPALLRDFNRDMIDSTVNQTGYNTDSGSWNQSVSSLNAFTASASGLSTGSLLITASAAGNTITFTKGNGTTFNVVVATGSIPDISNLNQATASLQAYTASANIRFSNLESTTASLNVSISNINAFTASTAISIANLNSVTASQQTSINKLNAATASYATTGSNTFVGANTFTSISASSFVSASAFVGNGAGLTGITASVSIPVELNGTLQGNATTLDFYGNAVGVQVIGGIALISVNAIGTGSFNAYTSSTNAFTASTNTSITNINSTTASLNTSASLALVTASFDNNTRNLTFTKGNTTQFSVNIPDVSGSAGNFVTTSSFNTYTASVNTSLTNINATTASQQVSINALNAATSSYITSAQTSSMSVASASVASGVSASISTQNSQHFVTFTDGSTGTQAVYTDGGLKYNPNQDLLLIPNITASGYISASSLNVAGPLTASLQQGYTWVGNGSNVSTLVATSSFGTSINTGSFATTGSNTFTNNQYFAPNINGNSWRLNGGNGSTINSDGIRFYSGSASTGTEWINMQAVPSSNVPQMAISHFPANNHFIFFKATEGANEQQIIIESPLSGQINNTIRTISNLETTGSISVSNNLNVTNNISASTLNLSSNGTFKSNVYVDGNIEGHSNLNLYGNSPGISIAANSANSGSPYSNVQIYVDNDTDPANVFSAFNVVNPSNGVGVGFGWSSYSGLYSTSTPILFANQGYNGSDVAFGFPTNIVEIWKPTYFKAGLEATGSTIIQTLTASLQQGYTWVGDSTGKTKLVATSSFGGGALPSGVVSSSAQITAFGFISSSAAGTISSSAQITSLGFVSSSITASSLVTASVNLNTITFTKGDASTFSLTVNTGSGGGGAAFPYTGSAQITGSLGITGSVSSVVNTLTISSLTASMDFNTGNFFTLQLVSGSITHLTATNIKPGQAINLLVKTDSGSAGASGSLAFSPAFKFAGGFKYTPTAVTASQDLVSFVTFDTTQILAAQVKNLS